MKYKKFKTRASSPKWIPRNTALVTSQSGLSPDEWQTEPKRWGRLVEIAVGAHLVNLGEDQGIEVYYWRERNKEVDFVLKKGHHFVALEIKTSSVGKPHTGLAQFQKHWPETKSWIISPDGLDLADFLNSDLTYFFA